MHELSLKGVSVMLAIPVNRDFPWQTNLSIVKTVCALNDYRVEFDYKLATNGSLIQKVRSELAHQFLKSKANRLFWIDSDMEWEPEAFLRILALSTVMPIVGAAYPAKRDGKAYFFLSPGSEQMRCNEWGCIQVKGFGLGFTCVQREVIERLAEKAETVPDDEGGRMPMIFRCGILDGRFHGEDMNFFADCRALGYEVNADPSIELGHVGGKAWRGKLMDTLDVVKEQAA